MLVKHSSPRRVNHQGNSDSRAGELVLVLVLLILATHAGEHQTDYQQDDAKQPGDDRKDGGGELDLEAVVVVGLDAGGHAGRRRLQVLADKPWPALSGRSP